MMYVPLMKCASFLLEFDPDRVYQSTTPLSRMTVVES